MNIAITGGMLAAAFVGVGVFLLGLILLLRRMFAQAAVKGKPTTTMSALKHLIYRNKLPSADVFRWSGTFFNIALVTALLVVTLAFNWTEYEEEDYVVATMLTSDEDIMIEPPRTIDPPPIPPPPPLPPVIEEVPEDEIDEDEEVVFIDNTIEATDPVIAPEPVEKTPPPPAVAPPLPRKVVVDEIFKAVEQQPRFLGCEEMTGSNAEKKACADAKLYAFINKHIKYPAIARENGISGTCYLQFVVEKDGRMSSPKIVRDIGGGCGEEALRVIKLMNTKEPSWNPGKQRGTPVRVMFNMPIKFNLQ